MGCARGWNHFCTVLKCPVPNSESRSQLQPPTGSLFATRVGLGLEPSCHASNGDVISNGSDALSNRCPNYRHSRSSHITDPSLRRDDATTFIEDAVATKFPIDPEETDSSCELLPPRGQKRPADTEAPLNDGRKLDRRRYRCGRCAKVQTSPLGCISCRREQLVKETSGRDLINPNGITREFLQGSQALSSSHNYDEGFIKVKSLMLQRASLDDVVESKKRSRSDNCMCGLLTKECWTPNVILPPKPKYMPTPKVDDASEVFSESDDASSIASGTSCSSNDASSKDSKPQAVQGDTKDSTKPDQSNESHEAHTLRKSRRTSGEPEDTPNRQLAGKKHKESADDLSRRCLSIACSGILIGMIRRDPLRLFAKPAPSDMEEYHKVIKDPIDFQTMRQKLLSNEYATLGSFVSDAKRLCINACVFNSADSLYALTAKQIYDALVVMIKRAQQWIAILKNTHASSFITNDDSDADADIFKDVELVWPGAVALLNDGSWLEREAQSDFFRTKENEMAYYGMLAVRRATAAACESLAPAPGIHEVYRPVSQRTHIEDEVLRERINHSASLHDGPAQLKERPDWREEQLLKLLKTVQRLRVDIRNSSETGCARCDTIQSKEDRSEALSLLRSNGNTIPDTTKQRVVTSRSYQSTGLASRNARNAAAAEEPDAATIHVACEAMVSVKGSGIHGWGLFSDHPFKKGVVVAEYIGEYINNAVADAREKYYRKQRIQDYQFRVSDGLVIDATLNGGYARYINHSCDPNCEAKIIDGEHPNEHLKRVLIISQRDIDATEELTYDYHFPLETDLKNRVPCNCMSKYCRGFMNWDIPEKMKFRAGQVEGKGMGKGRVNSKKK